MGDADLTRMLNQLLAWTVCKELSTPDSFGRQHDHNLRSIELRGVGTSSTFFAQL